MAKRSGAITKHRGGGVESLLISKRGDLSMPVQAGLVIIGAASVSKLDAMIPFRPLGDKVPPSVIALAASVAGAVIASHHKNRKTQKACTMLAVGLGVGILGREIAKKGATP